MTREGLSRLGPKPILMFRGYYGCTGTDTLTFSKSEYDSTLQPLPANSADGNATDYLYASLG